MAELFNGRRGYTPVDVRPTVFDPAIRRSDSDHIYAEIFEMDDFRDDGSGQEEEEEEATPPLNPRRPDTPILEELKPSYPPYSSVEVARRRNKSVVQIHNF